MKWEKFSVLGELALNDIYVNIHIWKSCEDKGSEVRHERSASNSRSVIHPHQTSMFRR